MSTSEIRKKKLEALIMEFEFYFKGGHLNQSQEETTRSYINKFLNIFGWSDSNPLEVSHNQFLDSNSREKLKAIESNHKFPDYLLYSGNKKFLYIEAKKIKDNVEKDKKGAFQIRSYTWSTSLPCGVLTNFKELAIYNGKIMPSKNEDLAHNARVIYLKFDEYIENFDLLESHFLKESLKNNKLQEIYSKDIYKEGSVPLDKAFSEHLRSWRLILAKDLFNNRNKETEESISDIIQILMDRIIFIRVAEGLKIEKIECLLDIAKSNNSWKNLILFFKDHCYKIYGGVLFDDRFILDDIILDDSNITSFIESLYIDCPYRFNVISPALLGNVYERYLSRKLVIVNNEIKDDLKAEYQKTKGAVYTPEYIVNKIIFETLDPLFSNKNLKEFLNIRIIDPSCGSGSFLLGVFDYLENLFKFRYSENKDIEFIKRWFWEEPRTGRHLLRFSAKKRILDNCIYGLDIDTQAIGVSHLSLSLKMLENFNSEPMAFVEASLESPRFLDGVGLNIKTGNALIDSRIFNFIPSIISDIEAIKKLSPFDWDKKEGFKRIIQEGGFDAVVGNPPYIEIKTYKKESPFMHKYLSQKENKDKNKNKNREYLSCGDGKTDISIAFIEKGLKILSPNGRLGFIIQNRFFKTSYGKGARAMLSIPRVVEKIIDFGSLPVFPDHTTYTCILILNKSGTLTTQYQKIDNLENIEEKLIYPEKNGIDTLEVSSNLPLAFWSFSNSDLTHLHKDLLQKFLTIADHKEMTTQVGLQVLYKKIYSLNGFVKENYIEAKNLLHNSILIEENSCRPFVFNRKFFPFKTFKKESFVIFPYEIILKNNKPEAQGIPFGEFSTKYPLAGKYLEDNKETVQLMVKTKTDKDQWHLYTYEKNLVSQSEKKILVPSTILDTVAGVDLEGTFYHDNVRVNSILIKEASDELLIAVSCIINSRIFDCLAKITSEKLDNNFIQFNKQFLESVPFPFRELKKNTLVVKELAGLGNNLIKNIDLFINELEKETKKALSISIKNLYYKIDEIVTLKVYNLTEDQLAVLNLHSNRLDIVDMINHLNSKKIKLKPLIPQ